MLTTECGGAERSLIFTPPHPCAASAPLRVGVRTGTGGKGGGSRSGVPGIQNQRPLSSTAPGADFHLGEQLGIHPVLPNSSLIHRQTSSAPPPPTAASVVYPTRLSFLGAPCSSRSSSGPRSFQNGPTWALETLPSRPTSSGSTLQSRKQPPLQFLSPGSHSQPLTCRQFQESLGHQPLSTRSPQGSGAELSQECSSLHSSSVAAQGAAVGLCSSANTQFWGDRTIKT